MNYFFYVFGGILLMNRFPKLYRRTPYRSHHQHINSDIWMLMCAEFQNKKSIPSISKRTGIPATTLYTWRKCYRNNPTWSPQNNYLGKKKRIFSDSEENELVSYITSIIEDGNLFTNEDFKEIAIEYYLSIHELDEDIKPFNCSKGFIADFKSRHKFTSKRFHYKRRPNVTPQQEEEWINNMRKLLTEIPHSRIVNCDETSYCLYPKGLLTWAIVGEDNVRTLINGSEKENITVIASITADGEKLPLMFIAKGKTERVEESQIGDISSHWKTHSETGWMTNETFQEYLKKLREHFGDNKPIHLVLDCYKTHKSEVTKNLAKNLNMSLHFIPPGMTDAFQPLDRKIFGIVKAFAKRLYRQRIKNSNGIIKKADACQDMISAWNQIQDCSILDAWDIYDE